MAVQLFRRDAVLMGHVGVDTRSAIVGGRPATVAADIDLCVGDGILVMVDPAVSGGSGFRIGISADAALVSSRTIMSAVRRVGGNNTVKGSLSGLECPRLMVKLPCGLHQRAGLFFLALPGQRPG